MRYNDCCVNAKAAAATTTTSESAVNKANQGWTCHEFRDFGNVFVRGKCPATWADDTIREKCEQHGKISDPVGRTAAQDGATKVTYKNVYCAQCHAVTGPVAYWPLRLQCDGLDEYNKTYANLTADYVRENLIYFEHEQQWGIELKYPYLCEVDPFPPETAIDDLRHCHQDMISECAPDWKDEQVRQACHAYQAVVHSSDVNGKKYRNAHCALCNGEDTNRLTCQAVTGKETKLISGRNRPLAAFALLFDINGADTLVGDKKMCQESNQVYDPFFKTCRTLTCSPNTQLVNGACVDIGGDVATAIDANDTTIGTTTSPTTDTDAPATTATSLTTAPGNGSFQSCAKLLLDKHHYLVLKNGSVFVPEYNSVFNATMFVIQDDEQLLICSPFSDSLSDKFPVALGYVTMAGLVTSIACLLLHLIAFTLTPEMRNLSGRNLASLSLCLLIGYVSFILTQHEFVSQQRALCTAVSALLYYSFLVSFLWMNVMAFDVWRTLSLAATELRVSSGKQSLRFIAYATYCLVIGGVFVSLALALDFAPISQLQAYRPGFAVANKCWFTNRKSLVVFFAGPVAAIMLSNIAFFALTALIIVRTTARTATANCARSQAHKNFKLYARLAVLMGLAWALAFVASFTENLYVWCAFTLCNTLQGVFIFISFTCNHKVRKSLRERFKFSTSVPPPAADVSGGDRSFGTGSTALSLSRSSLHSGQVVPPLIQKALTACTKQ